MHASAGNVAELLAAGLCILAMTFLMSAYLDHVQLIHQKTELGGLARKYILRMETTGVLTGEDQMSLTAELTNLGVTQISLEGTTLTQVGYGEPVILQISGYLEEEYAVSERRVSTAKN